MTDTELTEFAAEFRDGILDGAPSSMRCAMVVWPMVSLLGMSGVPCHAVETKDIELDWGIVNHIWIQLEDGRVLDPTADQFNDPDGNPYPEIYLGPPLPHIHRQ